MNTTKKQVTKSTVTNVTAATMPATQPTSTANQTTIKNALLNILDNLPGGKRTVLQIPLKVNKKWVAGGGCDGSECKRCINYRENGLNGIFNCDYDNNRSLCGNFGSSHCSSWSVASDTITATITADKTQEKPFINIQLFAQPKTKKQTIKTPEQLKQAIDRLHNKQPQPNANAELVNVGIYAHFDNKPDYEHITDITTATPFIVYNYLEDITERKQINGKIRAYTNTDTLKGLAVAEITIVKRFTASQNAREGSPFQDRLYTQARQIYQDYAYTNGSIMLDTHKYSHDIQDLLSVAQLAFLENANKDIKIQYSAAYTAINAYMESIAAIRLDEKPMSYSLEYLTENGIELVKCGKVINMLTDNDAVPQTTYTKDKRKTAAILELVAICTPVQLKVLKLLAKNYSQRQIAAKLKRSLATIKEHTAIIRKKACEVFGKNYPDIIPFGVDTTALIARGKHYQK